VDEAKIRIEIQNMLVEAGLEYYHPADTGFTENARPDILSVNKHGGIVIEVKIIEKKKRIEPWFDPKKIPNRQRRQLDYYCWDRHINTYLAIGTTFGKPRRIWLVEWYLWVEMEKQLVELNEGSLDFRINMSDLVNRNFQELIWNTGGKWTLPWDHVLLLKALPRINEWIPRSIRFPEEVKTNE